MLSQFISATGWEPFQWGQNDCALWAASAVKAVTGFDPAEDLRGTYATWFDCRRLIMKAGGLEALIAPRMARFCPLDGDGVAIVVIGGRRLCGLVHAGRLVVKMEDGLRFLDDYSLVRGWSW